MGDFFNKKLLINGLVWLMMGSAVCAEKSMAGSGFDSGGRSVSSPQTVLTYQTISPLVSGMTSSAGGKTLIHDLQFSSSVSTVNGFSKPLVKQTVTFNAIAKGLIVTKVEFKAETVGGLPLSHSNIIDTTKANGWQNVWNSVLDTSDEVTINVFARAFDGLSWGPWLQINMATIVDNHAPTLLDLGLLNPAFSPNGSTSIGIKDTTQFSYQVTEKFFNQWVLSISPVGGGSGSKTFTSTNKGTVSQVWNGKDESNVFSPEGRYNYDFSAFDAVNNISHITGQITLDNTAPTFLSTGLVSTGKAINSQKGDISASWNVTDAWDATPSFSVSLAENSLLPRKVGGLTLWYDAMDADTFYSVGSKTTWEDKSGNKYNAVQSTPSKAPTRITSAKGVSSVSFDGTDDYLAIENFNYPANAIVDELTVFAVVKSNNCPSTQVVISFDNNRFWALRFDDAGNVGKFNFSSKRESNVGNVRTTSSYNDGNFHEVSCWWKYNESNATVLSIDSTEVQQSTLYNNKHITGANKRYGMLGVESGALTFDGTKAAATYLKGNIAELLVYSRALSSIEKSQVENYLHTKWRTNTGVTWNAQVSGQSAKTWQKLDVNDTTYFAYKVNAVDDAGNQITTYSRTVMTPDRTAPIISPEFTTLSGVEDQNFNVTPSAFVTDNWNVAYQLGWTPALILAVEGSDYSEGVIQSIRSVGEYREAIEVKLISDANTASSAGGNRYGKENAFVKMRLEDRAGNYVDKKIQTAIAALNDAPRFLTEIGGPNSYSSTYYLINPDTGKIVFSEKFDEDTPAVPIYLDHYIDDVDNNLSDLSWTASGPGIYPDGIGTGIFRRGDFTYQIGNAVSNHLLTVIPAANWWGDEKAVIGVVDPAGGVSTRNFVARVWPVNDKPLISSSLPKVTRVNEDNPLQLTLSSYENDVSLEDEIPTYNVNLKWTVDPGYTPGIVKTITGQASDIDVITFTPTNNAYGTVNVVLRLTDVDQRPAIYYPIGTPGGGYTSNPLSSTASITLAWKPINDVPRIIATDNTTVSNATKDEDSSAWDLALARYRADVEDAASTLHWTFTPDRTDLLTISYNSGTDKLTFTPKPNAWGTTNVLITLTDNDTGIAFSPYTPNPLSATKNIKVVLTPINDRPIISSVALRGLYSIRDDKVMTKDKVTATVAGYTDIGYSSDTRNSSEIGDEYVSAHPIQNVKHYLYRWYSDGVALSPSFTESAQPTCSLTIDPTFEGKTLTLEVAPYDGMDSGTLLSKSIKVNRLPGAVSASTTSPNADSYFITGNVTASWGSVTDADTDDVSNIGYRAKAWKVEKLAAAPSDTSLGSTSFFDSDWQLGKRSFSKEDMHKTFEHGTYYWKVWTGNQFSSSVWDYKDTVFINGFNVDLIAPEISDFDKIIQVKNIGSGAIIEDAGLSRVLFGTKPVDNINDGDSEGYLYQILLGWENSVKNEFGATVKTTGNMVIVDFTDALEWSYTITYPSGTTTYNVYVQDIAGNLGAFKQRHISGTKPAGKSVGYTYSIKLNWQNDRKSGVDTIHSSGLDTVVTNTTSANWSYAVTYIEGTTTYNVVRSDVDGDAIIDTFTMSDISKPSALFKFTIIDDLTPPAPFKVNTTQYSYFNDVSSKNYYQLRGKKEKNSGLFYKVFNPTSGLFEQSQIVGFTSSEDYIATLYTSNPSGNLTTQDRNGNVQQLSTTINIRFLIGSPTLKVVSITPTVINSIVNKSLLPSTVNSQIFASKISWISSRNIQSATLKTEAGTVVASSVWVTANRVGQLTVSGNHSALSQGSNKLTLTIVDEAKNTQQSTVTVNVLKAPPSTSIILSNTEFVKIGGVWKLKVFGDAKPFVTVKINGESVTNLNNGTWFYEKSSLDPQTNNVVLKVTDDAYNSATKTIWDKSYYSRYSSQTAIELPIPELSLSLTSAKGIILGYESLPHPLVSVESESLRDNGVSLTTNDNLKRMALAGKTSQENLTLQTSQGVKCYSVFGRDDANTIVTNQDVSGASLKVALPFLISQDSEPNTIKVVKFNPDSQVWEPTGENTSVDIKNSKVMTTISSLGLYTVAQEEPFGTNLKEIRVYPNPWVLNDGLDDNGTLDGGIVFDHLTEHATIKIYTVSGEKIIEDQVAGARYQWDGRNQGGRPVVSGIYLYIISDGKTTKTGKVTIIR